MGAINSKFSRIIVAIDGSEHLIRAAEYALNLAKTYGAELNAVTVTYIPESHHLKQEEALGHSSGLSGSSEAKKMVREVQRKSERKQHKAENGID